MKTYLKIIIAACFIYLYACNDNSVQDFNPPGDEFSGYIVFADSGFIANGSYYVSIYRQKDNPFDTLPVMKDSLNITYGEHSDGKYSAYYRMKNVPAGKYYIASIWKSDNNEVSNTPIILGTDGCDTIMNCTDYELILFPNYEGVFRNFYSWLDTAKRLY